MECTGECVHMEWIRVTVWSAFITLVFVMVFPHLMGFIRRYALICAYHLGFGVGPHVPQQWTIDWSRLELHEEIGCGGFSLVYRATLTGCGEVAVKHFKQQSFDPQTLDVFNVEFDLIKSVSHPNIISLYGACLEEGHLSLVLEYCRRGSVVDVLHDERNSINWRQRVSFAVDASKGVAYLHALSPKVIHRDLKASNVLIAADWSAKISDFGLSKLKEHSFRRSEFDTYNTDAQSPPRRGHRRVASFIRSKSGPCGTPAWVAPEVLRWEAYNERADTYSFGVFLWELLTKTDASEADFITLYEHTPFRIQSPEERPDFIEIATALEAMLVEGLGDTSLEDEPRAFTSGEAAWTGQQEAARRQHPEGMGSEEDDDVVEE